MIITDTHTHLYSESFDSDRDEVITRAIENGITRFFLFRLLTLLILIVCMI